MHTLTQLWVCVYLFLLLSCVLCAHLGEGDSEFYHFVLNVKVVIYIMFMYVCDSNRKFSDNGFHGNWFRNFVWFGRHWSDGEF